MLHPAGNNTLILYYKVGPGATWWWGERKVSHDNGQSWSAAERLPNGMIGPVKNKPLALPDGRVLCGSSSQFGHWLVHVETTDALGAQWSRTGNLNQIEINAIQPSFLVHRNRVLQMVGRTKEKRVFSIFSHDNGRIWDQMSLLDVPNPDSGTDAVTLHDGRHLLVCNPVEQGRSPLVVMLSVDGLKWRQVLVLEDQPRLEVSYPAAIQDKHGNVHITYTWQRRNVKHVVVDPSRLPILVE